MTDVMDREDSIDYLERKGKPSKKIERNINHWYARFFFKEAPKDGYLEVIYK